MLCPAQMLGSTQTIECRFGFAVAFDLLLRLRLPPPFALNVGAELPYEAPGPCPERSRTGQPGKDVGFRLRPRSGPVSLGRFVFAIAFAAAVALVSRLLCRCFRRGRGMACHARRRCLAPLKPSNAGSFLPSHLNYFCDCGCHRHSPGTLARNCRM